LLFIKGCVKDGPVSCRVSAERCHFYVPQGAISYFSGQLNAFVNDSPQSVSLLLNGRGKKVATFHLFHKKKSSAPLNLPKTTVFSKPKLT